MAQATASFISPSFDDCMIQMLRLPFLHEAAAAHLLCADQIREIRFGSVLSE